MRTFGWIVLAIILIAVGLGAIFGLEWLGIEKDKILKPKREAVEREVFENTPSYVRGFRTDMAKHHFEWMKADEDGKKLIESAVRNMYASHDPEHLNPELRAFWRRCMGR